MSGHDIAVVLHLFTRSARLQKKRATLTIASIAWGTVTILMLLAEGFHRQPFIDLAVVFAPMSLVGALAFARLMESGIEETERSGKELR